MSKADEKIVTVRMPMSMIERIDDALPQLSKELMGVRPTRALLVRVAVEAWLRERESPSAG